MLDMFRYNWQVRQDWFKWCKEIPHEELIKERTGGMGSILATLFHVANGEQIWVNQMKGTPVIIKQGVSSLKEAMEFTAITQPITEGFLQSWNEEKAKQTLTKRRRDGGDYVLTYEKIIKHLMAHEIHHIGQLSIWAREIGRKPVSSDLIFRDY
ncbi:DinB family protein [Bacillus sp. SCS-153A]|uniref:DinB family protein n=1 Tax=Rossellomorea sedimentorum TaxID=3115294 RepID=UPI0039069D29